MSNENPETRNQNVRQHPPWWDESSPNDRISHGSFGHSDLILVSDFWFRVSDMRRIIFLMSLLLASCASSQNPDLTMNLWPGNPPGQTVDLGPEKLDGKDITNVSIPTLSVWRATGKNTGAALIVLPGGGFTKVVVKKEGADVARWLADQGITAIMVKYRVPFPKGKAKESIALQDAQRAMCVVRAMAPQWGIDPNRIGMIGFSAGGRLVAGVSTSFDHLTYDPVDQMDQQSSRPDVALAIYPGDLALHDGTDHIKPDVHPTKNTPPTFLAVAQNDISRDDKDGSLNAVFYYLALNQAGVSAELHVFSEGGHGFALKPSDDPHAIWPTLALNWMKYHGFLGAVPATKPSAQD
jgi:acetyl esterase/lipase